MKENLSSCMPLKLVLPIPVLKTGIPGLISKPKPVFKIGQNRVLVVKKSGVVGTKLAMLTNN